MNLQYYQEEPDDAKYRCYVKDLDTGVMAKIGLNQTGELVNSLESTNHIPETAREIPRDKIAKMALIQLEGFIKGSIKIENTLNQE